MDYSKVTFVEYQAKKKAILNSIGRIEDMCYGIQCENCVFHTDRCNVSDDAEITNPLQAVKFVMDYEITVDWSKVEVDTPILVNDDKGKKWFKRHFAKYENGLVWAFNNGFTSWTGKQGNVNSWNYAKLAKRKE